MRILCVDDEPYILTTLQRFFRKDNFEVLFASSAEKGLRLLQEQGPMHIILSDYRMTGLNGVEFLQQVHQLWPQTVGILLSGYADESVVASAMSEDCVFRHISKPWTREELRGAIDDALVLGRDCFESNTEITPNESQPLDS